MITITPQKIDFFSKGQDGKELRTKRGDPYIKARITTSTEKIYLNVFDENQKNLLKVGQSIELETEQNGQYTNYSFPRKKSPQDIKIDELEARIKALESMVNSLGLPQINKAEIGNKSYDAEMIEADKKFNPTVENHELEEDLLPF